MLLAMKFYGVGVICILIREQSVELDERMAQCSQNWIALVRRFIRGKTVISISF